MKVVLADDEKQVCSALALLLRTKAEVSIVGEVSHTDDLQLLVQSTHPNLVLLDWELPGMATNDLLHVLHALDPDLVVIALSGQPEARLAAIAAGADGFISKGEPPEKILRTLRSVEPGGA